MEQTRFKELKINPKPFNLDANSEIVYPRNFKSQSPLYYEQFNNLFGCQTPESNFESKEADNNDEDCESNIDDQFHSFDQKISETSSQKSCNNSQADE